MVAKHLHNTIATGQLVQAHILYHWLDFVSDYTLIEANGANWTTLSYSGSTGVINSVTPQAFFDTNTVFDGTFVGKHIAIRDTTNAANCIISEITAFVSSTEITLDATTVFTIDATTVEYIVFDTAAPPSTGDFFVFQTPVATGPQWQARCVVSAGPAALQWQFGFTGGWDVGTVSWTLPVSTDHWMHATMQQTFCITDAQAGYIFIWSEDVGGVAANRNALWMGAVSPFHSPAETGVPKDSDYSAIFGSITSPAPSDNLSRDTTVADNFVVGEMLDESLAVIPVYVAQKRLLSSGNDVLALASTATNPRSSQEDDYDAVVFHKTPNQAWRGRLPAVRILNDNITNRFSMNSNASYVLGNGIGAIWNGKAPLP